VENWKIDKLAPDDVTVCDTADVAVYDTVLACI
jgi:hypothetical protein